LTGEVAWGGVAANYEIAWLGKDCPCRAVGYGASYLSGALPDNLDHPYQSAKHKLEFK